MDAKAEQKIDEKQNDTFLDPHEFDQQWMESITFDQKMDILCRRLLKINQLPLADIKDFKQLLDFRNVKFIEKMKYFITEYSNFNNYVFPLLFDENFKQLIGGKIIPKLPQYGNVYKIIENGVPIGLCSPDTKQLMAFIWVSININNNYELNGNDINLLNQYNCNEYYIINNIELIDYKFSNVDCLPPIPSNIKQHWIVPNNIELINSEVLQIFNQIHKCFKIDNSFNDEIFFENDINDNNDIDPWNGMHCAYTIFFVS